MVDFETQQYEFANPPETVEGFDDTESEQRLDELIAHNPREAVRWLHGYVRGTRVA